MGHKLVVIGGKNAGLELPISMPKCVIGRGEDCHIRPQNQLISRRHCIITTHNGVDVLIEDCGSANGTFINGEKLERQKALKNNDRIRIGPLEFEVQLTATCSRVESRRAQPAACVKNQNRSADVHPNNRAAKQPDHASQAGIRTVASANFMAGEAELLGWLDDKGDNNGNKNTAKNCLPYTNKTPNSGGVAALARVKKNENSQAVASVANPSTADLLDDVDALLGKTPELSDISFGKSEKAYSNLFSGESAVLNHDKDKQFDKEWSGCDLLMLAAVGPLLVIVLSWWRPLAWPENFSAGMAVKWFLKNWWHVWWLRWGLVAVLVTALLLLLRMQVRSKRRIST